ncbi:MAG TPA: protein translocase subunit SecF [Thermomicrobiales bacterium]|nr:protein translocase subunit SecF [Thermomicrobiales bacterium]
MFHLASRRRLWFLISLAVMVPGLVSLVFFGLRLGIDFTGGTLWEVRFEGPATVAQVDEVLTANGHENAVVQPTGPTAEHAFLIRSQEIREGSPEKDAIEGGFAEAIGPFEEREFSTVGGAVSTQIRNRAILAVAVASLGILAYIAYAFRNTQNPLLYGACALVAMLHDVLIVLGVFSILGAVANVEIDALFVTALLTVIGFSVHDTIVVFDRIRENLARQSDPTFEGVVNYSLSQTLVRSLNTSLTVIFTLLALYLFGGTTTRTFVLALLIGVVSGTYSSIFNASQLLVAWDNGEIQRFFGRFRGGGRGTGRAGAEPVPAP